MNENKREKRKERKLAAIMFSDMVSYSAMVGVDEAKGLRLREKNIELHRELIEKHHGQLLKDIGDAVLASFQSPLDAVHCAIDIQQAADTIPELKLRIGIHVGDVTFSKGDVHGNSVNVAARVQNIASPDQICITERVFADIRNKPEVETCFLGSRKLKNIEYPVKIYTVVYPGFKGAQPAIRFPSRFKPARKYALIALLLLIPLAVWYYSLLGNDTAKEEGVPTMKPLTTTRVGLKNEATWSPDGTFYAYASHDGEDFDIILSSVEGGNAIPLTDEPTDEVLPRWSPDGKKIAYMADRGAGINLYWRAATGGAERKITGTGLHMLENFIEYIFSLGAKPWSPDANRITFPKLSQSGAISLWEHNLLTAEEQQITFPKPGEIDLWGSRSPNGRQLVFERNGNIWLLTEEGKEIPLLEDHYYNSHPSFASDPDNVIFSSSRGGDPKIWQLTISSGNLEQLTFGEGWHTGAVVTPSGNLSFYFFTHTTDLFLINPEKKETTQLTTYRGNNFHPRISPDGAFVLYQSDRTGNYEIWMRHLNSGEEVQLTDHPAIDIKADWSPDGKEIVFVSQRTGEYQLWTLDLERRVPEQLTSEALRLSNLYDYAMNVRWSPDGQTIAYLAQGEQGRSVWLVDRNGDNQQVIIPGAHSFDWYIDGNRIVYNTIARSTDENPNLRIRQLSTGADTLLYNSRLTEIFVNPDGRKIGFIQGTGHWTQDIYFLPVQPPADGSLFPIPLGSPQQLTDGQGVWHAHNGTWSPDGEAIIYVRDQDVSNIYLLTGRTF